MNTADYNCFQLCTIYWSVPGIKGLPQKSLQTFILLMLYLTLVVKNNSWHLNLNQVEIREVIQCLYTSFKATLKKTMYIWLK